MLSKRPGNAQLPGAGAGVSPFL